MVTQQWSPIFGFRRYRLNNILEEFCQKYYNYGIFKFLLKIEYYLLENIDKKICLYDKQGREYGTSVIEPGRFIEAKISALLEEMFNSRHEPNGHNTFPDYAIESIKFGDIYFDSKAVLCKSGFDGQYIPKYNNACGSEAEVCGHILNFHSGYRDTFYLSFIIYTYYSESGDILDIKLVPMVYSINAPSKNWNYDKIRFNIKSRGTDGQVKNSNVTLTLPSFTCKSGVNTLDEQEALLSWATKNYLDLKQ